MAGAPRDPRSSTVGDPALPDRSDVRDDDEADGPP
jgi:hypothetical protein